MLHRSLNFTRSVMTNIVRNGSHGGVPGEVRIIVKLQSFDYATFSMRLEAYFCIFSLQNLPFDIHNRVKLTAMFIVFFGSGLGAPFLVLRHQLLKK